MKRILVATDGSDGADRAVDYAAHSAKANGAELLIANVIGGYGLPDRVIRDFGSVAGLLLGSVSQVTRQPCASGCDSRFLIRERYACDGGETMHP